MTAHYSLRARPASVATLTLWFGPQSVRLPMARTVRFARRSPIAADESKSLPL